MECINFDGFPDHDLFNQILSLHKDIFKETDTLTGKAQMAGLDIHHKTIGVFGMGRIGETVVRRASGFDVNIIYHNRHRKLEAEQKYGAKYVDFENLLAQADFLVCLAPLTSETRNLFAAEAFRKMKHSAIFTNASRGGLVDEEALAHALERREIAGAGLDVFKDEPISGSHALLTFDNVVALPHMGSASRETHPAGLPKRCLCVAGRTPSYAGESLINFCRQ